MHQAQKHIISLIECRELPGPSTCMKVPEILINTSKSHMPDFPFFCGGDLQIHSCVCVCVCVYIALHIQRFDG